MQTQAVPLGTMFKDEGEITFCLKTMCPNVAPHKSGYCSVCRTFTCPDCKKPHTITSAPHSQKLKFCAQCRRSKKNVT